MARTERQTSGDAALRKRRAQMAASIATLDLELDLGSTAAAAKKTENLPGAASGMITASDVVKEIFGGVERPKTE